MIFALTLSAIIFGSSGEQLLDSISEKYASADGIQWQIRSVVYSEIFEEAETTFVEFAYAPPDTFSMTSDLEKIVGVSDTLWVMSVRHRQIQKKSMAGTQLPFNFILNWEDSYNLEGHSNDGSRIIFDLAAREDVIPERLEITADRKMKIKEISYTDSKGDDVTLTIMRERLEYPRKIDFFFLGEFRDFFGFAGVDAFSGFGDAGVAGSDENFFDARTLGEFVSNGMITAAGADNKDFHILGYGGI